MAQDIPDYFEILSTVQQCNGTLKFAENSKKLTQLPRQELSEILVAWLKRMDGVTPEGLEMIRHAGILCASVSGLDDAVVDWLRMSPTVVHNELGLMFLIGYFGHDMRPSAACIDFLAVAIEKTLDRKGRAYAYALRVLRLIADPVVERGVDEQKQAELRMLLLGHLSYLDKHRLHPDAAESLRKLQDAETRRFYGLFDAAKNLEPAVLHGKRQEDVVQALTLWLGEWAKPGFFDGERMFYAGRLLGTAYPRIGLDRQVMAWLQQTPLTDRFATAAAFLDGYWATAESVDASCVVYLTQALTQVPAASEAAQAVNYALSRSKNRK